MKQRNKKRCGTGKKFLCDCVSQSIKQKQQNKLIESNHVLFFINHVAHVRIDISCKSYLFHFFKPARFKNKNWVIMIFYRNYFG